MPLCLWVSSPHTGRVVGATVTKRVLRALADSHPDGGDGPVTRVDIHRGWGGVVYVTIFGIDPAGPSGGREVREAVERSLGAERFRVRLEASG